MKKILCILAILLISKSMIFALEVPRVVDDEFKKKFFNATKVKWEKEGKNYEANFTMGMQKMSAVISQEGDWVQTEIEIDKSKIQKNILDYVNEKYPKAKILEFSNIESKEKGDMFEVEIKFKGKKIELYFETNGNPKK